MARKTSKKVNHRPSRALTKRIEGISPSLLVDIRQLIEASRTRVASVVNRELSLLYWKIGTRIREDVLNAERAEYGEKIVHELSAQLTSEYGAGFTRTNLFNMLRFAATFPDETIVHTVCGQLSWSHLRLIIYVEEPLAREFYLEMARLERWSVRALQSRMRTMLFERTAVSKKPEEVIRRELASLKLEDHLTPDIVFRDPYVLDFLGLHGEYAEKDIEAAIIRELERFIL